MYKKIALICIIFSMTFSLWAGAVPSLSGISAQSFVVLDARTNTVLYEHNARNKMSMASTTKIMTAIIALEKLSEEQIVKITPDMLKVEGTAMGLAAGDEISVKGLLTGLLLESGNDAANALAFHIAGSLEKFSTVMNQKAKDLGMSGSNFVTPSGLDSEQHYTTAYDMAILTSYSLKNPLFEEIVSTKKEKVTFFNPPKTVTYYNHNRLLSEMDGAIGVKTGFTKKSGRCLVSAARRNGATVVTVTLKAASDWSDHKQLTDYGFEEMIEIPLDTTLPKSINVISSDKKEIEIQMNNDIKMTLPKSNNKIIRQVCLPDFLYARITKGDKVGEVRYYINDILIQTEDVFASESADISVRKLTFWENLKMKIADFFS